MSYTRHICEGHDFERSHRSGESQSPACPVHFAAAISNHPNPRWASQPEVMWILNKSSVLAYPFSVTWPHLLPRRRQSMSVQASSGLGISGQDAVLNSIWKTVPLGKIRGSTQASLGSIPVLQNEPAERWGYCLICSAFTEGCLPRDQL